MRVTELTEVVVEPKCGRGPLWVCVGVVCWGLYVAQRVHRGGRRSPGVSADRSRWSVGGLQGALRGSLGHRLCAGTGGLLSLPPAPPA